MTVRCPLIINQYNLTLLEQLGFLKKWIKTMRNQNQQSMGSVHTRTHGEEHHSAKRSVVDVLVELNGYIRGKTGNRVCGNETVSTFTCTV